MFFGNYFQFNIFNVLHSLAFLTTIMVLQLDVFFLSLIFFFKFFI